MTTITCLVCGAAEEPGQDHTCPVCGADLPSGAPDDGVRDGEAGAATSELPDPRPAPDPAEVPEPAEVPDPAAAPDPPGPGEPASPTGSTPPPPPPPGGTPAVASRPVPYEPSHPSGLSSSLRTYGMLTHLSAFAGALVALAFVGPLIMWLVRRDEHPFLDHHGKEALNFNLSMLLYFVIGVVVAIATAGFGLVIVLPAAAVFAVTWVVTTILAAVKANAGEGYRYPLTIRFVGDDV